MILDSSYFSYALDEIVIIDSGKIGKMGMRTTDALQVCPGKCRQECCWMICWIVRSLDGR